MSETENLLEALLRWSIKLAEIELPEPWDASSFLVALGEVLNQADHEYFLPLVTGSQPPSPTAIVAVVSAFYREELGMQLLVHPPSKQPTEECLLELFRVVLGLALQLNRQKCLTKVLTLEVTDQEVLMGFVNELMQLGNTQSELTPPLNLTEAEYRQPTPSTGGRTGRQTYRLLDELELRESQCKLYREKLDELDQKHKELEYHQTALREQNQRLLDELHLTRNEKLELIIELGIRSNEVGYGDIVQRYREIATSYQTRIQDLELQLERKNQQLEERNNELELLRKNYYGSAATLPSESTISSEEYERMEMHFQSKLDELNHRIRELTQEIAEKDSFNCKLLEDKERVQQDNNSLRVSIAKSEQSLERYRQLKRLTKGFFKEVETQFRV